MYAVTAANNDGVPTRVLKSVAFVVTVVRRWYWSSPVWIFIPAYVLVTCACPSALDPLLVNVTFVVPCIALYTAMYCPV
jgi:hypothetical protein